jgi:hypothetical protein
MTRALDRIEQCEKGISRLRAALLTESDPQERASIQIRIAGLKGEIASVERVRARKRRGGR